MSALGLTGPLNLKLALYIPLYADDLDTLVNGQLSLDNNRVSLTKGLKLSLKQVHGMISFNQEGITPSRIDFKLYGQKHIAKLLPLAKNNGTQVSVTGLLAMNDFIAELVGQPMAFLSGHTPYQLDLSLFEHQADHYVFNSQLKGVSLNLPSPLAKQAKQSAKLHVAVNADLSKAITINANYDNKLQTRLLLKQSKNHWQLQAGRLHLSKEGTPLALPNKGLAITGRLANAKVSEWQTLINQLSEKTAASTDSSWFNYLKIHVGKLIFKPFVFYSQALAIQRRESGWHMGLSGQQLAGVVDWKNTKNPQLVAKLKKLSLFTQPGSAPYKPSSFSPDILPNMQVDIDSLKVDKKDLGTFSLLSTTQDNALSIKRLTLHSPLINASLKGSWRERKGRHRSQLEGQINVRDLSKLLRSWYKEPVITGRTGYFDLNLIWYQPFMDVKLSELIGQCLMTLKHGRITHLDKATESKIGIGKLLSLLSLQTLPRRLALDFTDLSQKGFSFDSVTGLLHFDKGNIKTNNTFIDGPVASAAIKGSSNVISKRFDITLQVFPHVASSLPVVATIAGGPVVGVAAWVASKVINQSMQRTSAYTYSVTGPWENPIVQQLKVKKY